MSKRLKELIACLGNCHCKWILVSKCCKSQCISDFEEYPHNSPQNSPEMQKKKEPNITLI